MALVADHLQVHRRLIPEYVETIVSVADGNITPAQLVRWETYERLRAQDEEKACPYRKRRPGRREQRDRLVVRFNQFEMIMIM